jgi:mannose-6-phosphate isomerase-like protein (cupin superfamily)
MSETPSDQSSRKDPVAEKIERFIHAVDHALADSGTAAEERSNIVDDLRVQIQEMLADRAAQSGKTSAVEDVEAVLDELDPPESYAEISQPKEAEPAFAGHGCGRSHRHGGWGGFHRGRHRGIWGKRHVVMAVRRAMESFSPFGQPAFQGMTDRARTAISLAKSEAQRMRHDFIGTEHLLLGLLLEGTGLAAKTLVDLGLERDWARDEAERLVGPGKVPPQFRLPLTPRLRQSIDESRLAARNLGHDFLGTEHLLLGLLAVPGVASQIIANRGLTAARIKSEILRRIPGVSPAAPATAGSFTYWPASTIQEISIGENRYKIIAGSADTAGAYTAIEAQLVSPDGLGPRIHTREDLSIYVLQGAGRLRVGERTVEIAKGDFSRIPRGTIHEFQPAGGSATFMLIATPGGLETLLSQVASSATEDGRRQFAGAHGILFP